LRRLLEELLLRRYLLWHPTLLDGRMGNGWHVLEMSGCLYKLCICRLRCLELLSQCIISCGELLEGGSICRICCCI
jgi:hypothetical protein